MIEYLLIINIITFFVYGLDKFFAKKKLYRFPETTLLFLTFVGGVLGAILAMFIFHHKTKKRRFQVLIPLATLLWLSIILGIYSK